MPADDLVLNVRQLAGYPPVGNASTPAALLMQLGLGGAYVTISPQALVSTALQSGGDMAIAGVLAVQAVSGGSAQFSNGAFGMLSAQKACLVDLAAVYGTLGGVQIATVNDLSAVVAAQKASTVWSFNGRMGDVRLWIDDIRCAGGAPIYAPRFEGDPRACTPPPTSNSSRLATTAFVANALAISFEQFAPIDSPNFTGVPTAPTPALGSSDGQLATTAFVQNAISTGVAGVASFNTRVGAVVLNGADITAAGGALLASPAFTGLPTGPTAAPGTNTTQLATTAFVMAGAGWAPLASPAFTGIPTAPTPTPGTNSVQIATTAFVMSAIAAVDVGVATFNGRSGAVMLIANDISGAGGALLASPAFTGVPTAPTPPPGDSSTRLATTAFVASLTGYAPLNSPAFTGVPTAPTATLGTNTLQLATTAFVAAAISASTAGVVSFNGRAGAVTLQANDLTAAGGALLASPAFTGTPTAPTAALGVSTTQVATCAFVNAALAGYLPLTGGGTVTGNVYATQLIANALGVVSPAGTGRSIGFYSNPTVVPTSAGARWFIGVDTAAETGSNAGSNFYIGSFSDSGVGIGNALTINRASGAVTFATYPTFNAGLIAFDTVEIDNNVSQAPGVIFKSGATQVAALGYDIANNTIALSNLTVGTSWVLDVLGATLPAGNAYKPGGGAWTALSDARIKDVVGDYPHGLEEVTRLAPVVYTYKGNDATYEGGESTNKDAASKGRRFVGLVAQAVEAVFPEMVTKRAGYIDGVEVDDLRDLDTTPLIFALVNAVKTLATRVAALETA
jgi:hypothetical protein